jgi:hypothetical protein
MKRGKYFWDLVVVLVAVALWSFYIAWKVEQPPDLWANFSQCGLGCGR